jgi:predicted acyltransferase (DUF342 family)
MWPWAPLGLTTVTAALLALPVTPALYELWKRGDAAPLPTSRHDGRIANFAEIFHSRLAPLRPPLERCRTQREVFLTSIDGMQVLLVGSNSEDFDFHPSLTECVDAIMLSQPALVPAGTVVEADLCTDSILELGEGSALRAARGASDIILGKNSVVLRWLHADGFIRLRRGSTAYGRISAGQSIWLEPGCVFEHMHSPQILTVDSHQGDVDQRDTKYVPSKIHVCQNHVCQTQEGTREDPQPAVLDGTDASDAFTSSRKRIRIQGDFVLAAGETLSANVIATGEIRLGHGAHLFGTAKSYKDTVIEQDACVHGGIVCGGTVELGPRSFVTGPLLAEADVFIARGTRVGEPDALTTISSCRIQIAAGCRLHGTVWARVRGSVEV